MINLMPEFLYQFRGYPDFDSNLKEKALQFVSAAYMEEHGILPICTERVDLIHEIVLEDLAYYEEAEEFEICTLLRDLLEYYV